MPNFNGIDISVSKASKPPTLTQLIIYFAFLIDSFLIGSMLSLVGRLLALISF